MLREETHSLKKRGENEREIERWERDRVGETETSSMLLCWIIQRMNWTVRDWDAVSVSRGQNMRDTGMFKAAAKSYFLKAAVPWRETESMAELLKV